MTVDKLNIKNEMVQLDRKNRDFYDELTDDEKKKFSPYLMIRWGSSVSGDPMLQAYYLMSANEKLNKNFFDVNTTQHKKLQWLMATTVSPGMGNQYHQWISPKKKEGVDNKAVKYLREQYPHLKEDEIQLMSKLNTKNDLKGHARNMGMQDADIKKVL